MESRTIAIERAAPHGAARRTWTAIDLQEGYYGDVFAFFSRRVRPREEAEDLTSATFLAAYQNLGKLRSAEPRLFLYGIARRKLADALRKRRDLSTLEQAASIQASEGRSGITEIAHVLREALSAIPLDQSEALMLQNLEDLSLREIALVMNRSEKSVKALLQRAKERLRSNSLLKSIAEEINV